jgi:hypothetical protein
MGGELLVLASDEGRELSPPILASGGTEALGPGDEVELPGAREYTSSPLGLDELELAKGTAGGILVAGNAGAVNVPWHNGHCIICPANWSAMVIIF